MSQPPPAPEPDNTDLKAAIADLAAHFRDFYEPGLAAWLDGQLDGDEEHLPDRVLEMFTHGMGGLLDRMLYTQASPDHPLHSEPVVDKEATAQRNELARRLYDEAKRQQILRT